MAKNDGTALQDDLQGALKLHCRYHPSGFLRLYDTRSAKNFLPAQPGDFLFLVPCNCWLLECKSTVTGESVTSMAHHGPVGKRQIAKHRLWLRAGHRTLYLYLDALAGRYEWHLGEAIIKKVNQPIWVGRKSELVDSLLTIRNL